MSSETEASLSEMMSLFPVEVFEKQLPAIVLKHQLYSAIPDRTQVDREMVRDTGEGGEGWRVMRLWQHTHTHTHTHNQSQREEDAGRPETQRRQ